MPPKVTINGFKLWVNNPVAIFKRVIGCSVAPTGTVTINCIVVALLTVAFVAPNQTILFATVVLKFVPIIVTVVPMAPLVGVKLVIVGTWERVISLKIKNSKNILVILFLKYFKLKGNKKFVDELLLLCNIKPPFRIA